MFKASESCLNYKGIQFISDCTPPFLVGIFTDNLNVAEDAMGNRGKANINMYNFRNSTIMRYIFLLLPGLCLNYMQIPCN